MLTAERTAIEFLRARWPSGVPADAIERAYLSGRLVEEAARAAVGENGEERLSDMLSAVWRDEDELPPAGVVIEEDMDPDEDGGLMVVSMLGEDIDEPIPFSIVYEKEGQR